MIIFYVFIGLLYCGASDAAPQKKSSDIEIFSAADNVDVNVNLKPLGELSGNESDPGILCDMQVVNHKEESD
ncbi:MAG TPA: hypothetical protein VH815_05875 [Acidobacteriota bacterium]